MPVTFHNVFTSHNVPNFHNALNFHDVHNALNFYIVCQPLWNQSHGINSEFATPLNGKGTVKPPCA